MGTNNSNSHLGMVEMVFFTVFIPTSAKLIVGMVPHNNPTQQSIFLRFRRVFCNGLVVGNGDVVLCRMDLGLGVGWFRDPETYVFLYKSDHGYM